MIHNLSTPAGKKAVKVIGNFYYNAYLIILTPASDFAPNPTNQMCVLCRGWTKRYDFLACKITMIEKKLALTEFAANTHSVFSLKQLI